MHGAHAFEGGISPFPAGSTGEYIAAMPPIPGLFAVEQINYSTSNGLYDNNGKKLPIPFETSAFSATTRLLASYPVNVLGANLYSQLVVPGVKLHTDVAGHSERHGGLSNITLSPAILRWGLAPHSNVTVGLDIALRSGSYSPSRPSVAVGYTSYQPVVAFRYKDPNGLDVGISNRLLFNSKNSDTGYRSGSGYVGDFTAGWNFGKWKVGAVGSYLNQFRDDKVNGVDIANNRARSFSIGPSVVYDAGAFSVGINYQQGVYAANTAKSNALWLNVAFPLWAKAPH
ncbi:transporter [Comamonas testosteroni]|uniref:SphA family protein n=1 Tax=Comamonas testosteroni TaxID=285 RepID=UPI0023AAD213|nr:transporter [Comamonas testosteroni]WEE80405.1 transporter [Comamonas testosteroni]